MRRRVAILLCLLAALASAPLAAAGPVGAIPLSVHEEGCRDESSWTHEYEHDDAGRFVGSHEAYQEDQSCSSADTLSLGAQMNDEEVARVEAQDEHWNGWRAEGASSWWANGTQRAGADDAYGWYVTTRVRASAAGEEASVEERCEDASYRTMRVNETPGLYEDSTEWRRGCGQRIDTGTASASRFTGCVDGYENGGQTSGNESSWWYGGHGACGEQAEARVAGEEVASANDGGACRSRSTWTWNTTWETSRDAECAQGTWVDVAGARVLVGHEWGSQSACGDDGCTHTSYHHEGVVVRYGETAVVVPRLFGLL